MSKYTEMSDEELRELSLKKNKKGSYTVGANRAYKVLQERHNIFTGIQKRTDYQSTYISEHGVDLS